MPINPQYHSDSTRQVDLRFDSRDLEPVTPYSVELKDEYTVAKNTLEELRQKEELVRRRAEHLEEISQKEDRFNEGRTELLRQIEAYLDLLTQEAENARILSDRCISTQQRFNHHLKSLESLNPNPGSRGDWGFELDHAIQQIEAAEAEIADSMPLINQLVGQKPHNGSKPLSHSYSKNTDNRDFLYWMKMGLAFTLPLMALIVAVLTYIFFLK